MNHEDNDDNEDDNDEDAKDNDNTVTTGITIYGNDVTRA